MKYDSITYRVCYEDTDAGGVVYYGNYLRYLERGRNEFLRRRGTTVKQFHDRGVLFPVVRVEIDYKAPSVYDDLLTIRSWIRERGRASVTFGHRVENEAGELLVEGIVRVACVDTDMKARRLPRELLAALDIEGDR